MMEGSLWNLGGLTWSELGKRVYNETNDDDVWGSAAQLAYYFLFALFPLLIFLTSIFGFVVGTNNELRDSLFTYLGTVLPASALELVNGVIKEVSTASTGGQLTIGLFLALWAASSGMEAITQTLNRAYGLKESRSWIKRRLLALGLTIALALLIISALIIILFGGHIIDSIAAGYGFGDVFRTVWKIAQYLVALIFVLLAFALIYYWSPDVREQKWYWISPGSLVGVALWLLVSFGFRLYLSYFDSYSATYGSLGAVIILTLWLYFTGFAILIGGEINSEIENAAAEAGNPEAKKKGEKAPNENLNETNEHQKQDETENRSKDKKQDENETIPPSEKTQSASTTHEVKSNYAKPATSETKKTQLEERSFLTKIFAIGSMLAGVFSGRKNENR